ncbi:DUF1513 domain-containing protein [Cognatishimia sp. MH4019]|uniref:DUF1513 domain-containing protein n=1 Tax=Cognatishimia sp. MH4019 TaxID=2854030 RepID=UPI001CD34179|nr:DUF1513 domain-containing protein [Cognatishimia sp. MH4019]
MTTRRQVLAGLLATGLTPRPSWADLGGPAFLSAAGLPDGGYALCGISAAHDVLFRLPLPTRGHAAAAHPTRPEAVAFARRPGTFALVIDCRTGDVRATLNAPTGRHFYGHGVFSQDGTRLYTTENDFEAGEGRIGIWDATQNYRRIAEIPSGGIGPHDIKRLPGKDTLVVANGGIETHPDSGRSKLNLPTMRPNLSYIDQGEVSEQIELTADLHKNSIRHLAVSASGEVAFAMQRQGDITDLPLLALHKRGTAPRLAQATSTDWRAMRGYIGSVAFSTSGLQLAVTSPRGGRVQLFDTQTATLQDQVQMADVCGVATTRDGLVVTSGTGAIRFLSGRTTPVPGLRWDNHLVAIRESST